MKKFVWMLLSAVCLCMIMNIALADSCTHAVTESVFDHDLRVDYEPIDDSQHILRYIGYYLDRCVDCGEELGNHEECYNEEFVFHDYHDNDGNPSGICKLCGYQCTHMSYGQWGYEWAEDTEFETRGLRVHHANGTYMYYYICSNCGEKVIYSSETQEMDDNHSYYHQEITVNEQPVCSDCGQVNTCRHEHTIINNDWTGTITYTDTGSNSSHMLNGPAILRDECDNCGVLMNSRIDESYSMEVPHNYNGQGVCSECGHENNCTHEHSEHYFSLYGEGTYTKRDVKTHNVSGSGWCYDYCEDCQQQLNYQSDVQLEETESHQFDCSTCTCIMCGFECIDHDFDQNNQCSICGYCCPHETYSEEQTRIEEGTFCMYLNEREHTVFSKRTVMFSVCEKCGNELISDIHYEEDDISGTENHAYLNSGVCVCNAYCPHEGIEDEEVHVRIRTEYEWVRKDAIHHVQAKMREFYSICPVCGVEVISSREIAEEMDGTEGECVFDDQGICRECGISCGHQWENGQCTICGYLCSHDFDGNGLCRNCSYQCSHEDSDTIDDAIRTEYEWISSEQHRVWMIRTIHTVCAECGYNGSPIETADASTTDEHTDDNQDGICDICGYGIQESFDWDVCDGILSIMGQGCIPSAGSGEETPWAEYRDTITKIIIDANITSIGDYAFAGFSTDGLRIEFNQRNQPVISSTAFTGTENAVCRYFTDNASWIGGNYGGENTSWVYLPTNEIDGNPLSFNYFGNAWYIYVEDEQGHRTIPMTAAQVNEAAYGKYKALTFGYGTLPVSEEDQSVYKNRDWVSHLSFDWGCEGVFNFPLGDTSNLQFISVASNQIELNISDPRENGQQELTVYNGVVNYNGHIQKLILKGSMLTGESVLVTGDVDVLTFYDKTAESPYSGSLTVNGTIKKGYIWGNGSLDIPGVGVTDVGQMLTASFENLQQDKAVIANGELTAEDVTPVVITTDMYTLDYNYFRSENLETNLALYPKYEYYDQIGETPINLIGLYISPEDIVWGNENSVTFQSGAADGVIELNGIEDEEGNITGLGRLDLQTGKVKINCPVDVIYISNRRDTTEAAELIINNEVQYLGIEEMTHGFITIGEKGSVESGLWSRKNLSARLFERVTEEGDLFSDGVLRTMSWKEGQQIRAKLPSDEDVTVAAGLNPDGSIWAMADINDSSENNLTSVENEALSSFLEEKETGAPVSIFDVTVTSYSEDENGNIIPGNEISSLDSNIGFTVNNNTGEDCYIVRLHEEDGAMTATQLTEPTDEETLQFSSNLFSKYVIVSTSAAQESEVSWRVVDQRLIISGSGPMEDYTTAADAPWYNQREEIRQIILEAGVTRVGKNAFCGMTNTVRVDFMQRVLPEMDENAFYGSDMICHYYREGSSWTGSYGATSVNWIYLPFDNTAYNTGYLEYYADDDYWGTGWVYSHGSMDKVDRVQAEELTYMGRRVRLYSIPEEQADINVYDAHWDAMVELSFLMKGEGTFELTIPNTATGLVMNFKAPGWTLKVNAQDADEGAFAMVEAGGGTLIMTAPKICNLFLRDWYAIDEQGTVSGNVTINADVDTLNYYNTSNDDYRFAGTATINGRIGAGYEYGSAIISIPNIPEFTESDALICQFSDVNQSAPIILNSRLNVPGVTEYGNYTEKNTMLSYTLQGEDWWRLQINPLAGGNAQPVHAELNELKPDFTKEDIYWGSNTMLSLNRATARTGETLEFTVPEGKKAQYISVMQSTATINGEVYQMDVGDWDGGAFHVTLNGSADMFRANLRYKTCEMTLGANGFIKTGELQRPLYENLYFENVGTGEFIANSEMRVLSHLEGQRISSIMPSETTLSSAAGLTNGTAIMTVMDSTLNENEVAILNDVINTNGGEVDTVFDVNVRKYDAEGQYIENATELNAEVPITVSNLTGTEAYVARLHDGTAEKLDCEAGENDKTITFSSDKFSKYILVRTGNAKTFDRPDITVEYYLSDNSMQISFPWVEDANYHEIKICNKGTDTEAYPAWSLAMWDSERSEADKCLFHVNVYSEISGWQNRSMAPGVYDAVITLRGDGYENTEFRVEFEVFESLPEFHTNILPSQLEVIEEEAFTGSAMTSVEIPNQCTEIGKKAFDGSALETVLIPDSVTSIREGAFPNETAIFTTKGSEAQRWAEANGYKVYLVIR